VFPMCYLNMTNPYFRSAMPNPSPFSGSMHQVSPFPGPAGGGMGAPGGVGALPGFNAPQPQASSPSDFEKAPGSPTDLDTEYTQGYLRTQIGKRMRITFLIGANMQQDREGILVNVGISYIILNETSTKNLVLCDIYSIKFVNIYPS
jgi:hypothetical protein